MQRKIEKSLLATVLVLLMTGFYSQFCFASEVTGTLSSGKPSNEMITNENAVSNSVLNVQVLQNDKNQQNLPESKTTNNILDFILTKELLFSFIMLLVSALLAYSVFDSVKTRKRLENRIRLLLKK